MEGPTQNLPQGIISSLDSIQQEIRNFLNSENKILMLSSLDLSLRDKWILDCIQQAKEYPVEKLAHSSRIAKLIQNRVGIEVQSIYQTIYGRPSKVLASEAQETEELEGPDLQSTELKEIAVKNGLETVPIKSDKDLSLNAVIILHEAHLISSTKVQNDILNFGTGCLLNDMLFHLELEKNNRKLILIGDPYLLSFGKYSETALNVEHLASIFKGKILALAHQCEYSKTDASLKQRAQLAHCIDNNIYNNLHFNWNQSLIEVSKDEVKAKMIEWFNGSSMASNCVMVYTNGEASRINKWVKNHILKNSEEINVGDLLLTQNNVHIHDDLIMESSKNIYNGTFLKVVEVIGPLEPIIFEKINIKLEYLKLRVKVLKGMESNEMVVNVLLNFFNQDELTKEQHLALRILASTKYYELKKKYVFEESVFYKNAVSTDIYKEALTGRDLLIQAQNNGEKRLKSAIEKQQKIINRILKKASQKLDESLKLKVVREDEFVNALHVRHGWAITVHKSIGFQFDEVIFKADSEFFTGFHNRNYFSWVYSGLSASSKIYLSNPKKISPIDGCKFEDSAIIELINTTQLQKKSKLVFTDYVLPQSVKEKSGDNYNANVLACISKLTNLFVHFGVLLEQIDKKDNYLYKAIYSLQDALGTNLIVAVNNNGKGEVSSVRIEKCPEIFKNQVQQVIDKLFEITPISVPEETVDGFRLQLINEWKEKASTHNFYIEVLKCHSNHDFLKIEDGKNHAKFKMTYNASGFITGITVLSKTEDSIVNQLKKIIFDEY
jgi:hypothetical protein